MRLLSVLVLVVVVVLVFNVAYASSVVIPNDPDCTGTPNTNPVYTAAPKLVKQVPNGKLFLVGSQEPPTYVVHLYGSPYDMGYAQGELLKKEINTVFAQMRQYIQDEVDHFITKLPKYIQKLIEKYGIAVAMEGTYLLTKPFIPKRFTQEIQGLADATNNTLDEMMQLILFPELIQASCSMMGAWGDAVNKTSGSLYQLRALDWDTDTPMQQYPAVLVYHPEQGDGNAFVQLGWTGMIGAITGMSESGVGICEKVWIHYKGKQNRAGMPFHFMLRDILQFDESFDDAISRIATVERTCSIFVGVGSADDDQPGFNALEYSFQKVQVFNDHNMPNHTQFTDVVYLDKHTQPSSHTCMPTMIKELYGSLDAEAMIQQVAAVVQTGDMHVASYDFAGKAFYFANASPFVNGTTVVPAYNREIIRLDLVALFAEPKQK